MRSAVLVAVLAVAAASAGCGDSRAAEWPNPTWATDVDVVAAALTEAYDAEDVDQTARFCSAGGTLDLSIWGLGVLTTPDEIVDAVERLWHQRAGFATVDANQVFVTPDGAVIWWQALAWEGFQVWAQMFVFGGVDRVTSRAYSAVEAPFHRLGGRSRSCSARRAVPGGVGGRGAVRVGLRRRRDRRGRRPARGDRRRAARWRVPMLQARPLVFDPVDDIVGWETRYTHVPSARRCLADLDELGDGWWATFELPADLQENVTGVVDAGGTAVELVNAEPSQRDFARWLVERFVESGRGPPPLVAMWFPPRLDCDVVAEPDDRPPSGWPRRTVATGTIEHAAAG